MKRSARRLAARAGLAAIAAFVLLELLLRALGYNALQWYRADPRLGWTLRPGVSGWYRDEGESFVRVNSAGQRDREHSLAKPAGVFRIAVLGDAYSEAMQVPAEASYWARLPALLERCGFQPGKRIEALNFGVRDYGTAQAYLVLESQALAYRPDLVLLQFSHGNDVRDNFRALDAIRGRPYFRLDAGRNLELDASFVSDERYAERASPRRLFLTRALDHSRVLQLARRLALDAVRSAHAGALGNEAGLEIPTIVPPRDREWDEAWQVTEALIAKVGEAAARQGARTVVVVAPFGIEVHPDAALRERLAAKYGVADFAYPDRRVVDFARSRGMQGILLAPQMREIAAASGTMLNTALRGHWNAHGHRVAAELIAQALCERSGKGAP